MKASRLLSLLLLLQTRQRVTTAELAERLEVSRRAILRDVEALQASGVPVYAERGRHGGVVLLPGARLNASHLDPLELDVLALTGLDDRQRASLGLADITTLTERKLDARRRNAPETGGVVPLRSVVVTDNRPWTGEEPGGTEPAALVDALRAGSRLRIEYRRSGERATSTSVVDPYGIASKAGRWYLVADHDGTPRLFALTRLAAFAALPTPAAHRDGVTLDGVWAELRDRVERPGTVAFEVRLRRTRVDLARRILGTRLVDVRDDDDEWSLATVRADHPEAVRQLLQFGDHIEVLAPESARRRVVDLAHDLAARHAASGEGTAGRDLPRSGAGPARTGAPVTRSAEPSA